jgi:enamine deaminase RidA (YjgF/YER057c/UK114 family)
MPSITRLHTNHRMSQAVIHGDMVYLAGQVAAEGKSVTVQTTDILAQIDALLTEAGTSRDNMLTAQIWLASMDDFAEMNAVWDAWVPQGHCPARYAGEAKLATPGFLVEIIVTAAK